MRTALLFALLLALFGFAYAQQVAIEPNASPPVCSMTAVYKAGRAVSILNDKTGEVEAAFVGSLLCDFHRPALTVFSPPTGLEQRRRVPGPRQSLHLPRPLHGKHRQVLPPEQPDLPVLEQAVLRVGRDLRREALQDQLSELQVSDCLLFASLSSTNGHS